MATTRALLIVKQITLLAFIYCLAMMKSVVSLRTFTKNGIFLQRNQGYASKFLLMASRDRVLTPSRGEKRATFSSKPSHQGRSSYKSTKSQVPVKKEELEDHKIDEENLKMINEPFAILNRGKARLFKEGNPIVYNGAIDQIRGNPKAGQYILVTDHHGNAIGRGFYNPHSLYRVRLITFANERPLAYTNSSVEDVLTAKVRKAIHMRSVLLSSPLLARTTAYRLINGEGDGLSGCIVDVFNDYIVIQSAAYWVEEHRSTIEKVFLRLIKEHPFLSDNMKLIWKRSSSRLTQDGFVIPKDDPLNVSEKASLSVVIEENGVKYEISPYIDQKTGFYCDQRENRHLIRSFVYQKHVLDLFSYTGGFSLNAALHGNPLSVTAVDSSSQAIERAKHNYELNKNDASSSTLPSINFLEGDAINIMKQLKEEGKEYDFIVCDPPKLAPTKQSLQKARHKYQQINLLAMNLINSVKGGYLFTFTCSAVMSQQQSNEFISMLQDCAKLNNRFMTVLKVVSASSDHPIALAYPESHYLTGVLLYIH